MRKGLQLKKAIYILNKNLIILFLMIGSMGLSSCGKGEIVRFNSKQTSDQITSQNQSSVDELPDQFMNLYMEKNSGEINRNNCTNPENQPMAKKISQTFDTSDGEVLKWHCDGYDFEDILIALETRIATGVSVDELLKKSQNQEWEEIWEDVGFSIED